jgi:hypothetical protein
VKTSRQAAAAAVEAGDGCDNAHPAAACEARDGCNSQQQHQLRQALVATISGRRVMLLCVVDKPTGSSSNCNRWIVYLVVIVLPPG